MGPRVARVRWSAPGRSALPGTAGIGGWVTGDAAGATVAGATMAGATMAGATVVRVAADGVVAYDLADGRIVWTFQVPVGGVLGGMSRDLYRGVGLLDHRRGDGTARTVALSAATGTPVWERPRRLPSAATEHRDELAAAHRDELAVCGDAAVVVDGGGVTAVGLRDGDERWRLPAGDGHRPVSVAAAPDQVTVLEARAGEPSTVRVRTVDPGSGRERSRATVRIGTGGSADRVVTAVLRADPVVLWTSGAGRDGAAVAFDPAGGWRASVPRFADGLEIVPGTAADGAPLPEGRVVGALAVVGDTLVAPVRDGLTEHPTRLGSPGTR
jgi:outer membrane protein assembly factor BamB